MIVEILWTLRNLIGLKIDSTFLIYKDLFKTEYGNFEVHKDLQSVLTVSPTFEIDDILELILLISKHVEKKEKILFLDVGAHVGTYSIAIGNEFKNYKNLDIIGFEPEANNFYKKNSSILMKNIKLNKISNFKLYKIGLGDRNGVKPNKYGIITRKLDSLISKKIAEKYDVVFIKIDIEGQEESALMGARLFLKSSRKLHLLVEDCVGRGILKYLRRNFVFHKKLSPYNSFWTK